MLDASFGDPQLHLATIRLADNRPCASVLTVDPRSVDSQTLRVLESETPRLSADEIVALTRAEACKAAAERDFEQAYGIRQNEQCVIFNFRCEIRSLRNNVETR